MPLSLLWISNPIFCFILVLGFFFKYSGPSSESPIESQIVILKITQKITPLIYRILQRVVSSSVIMNHWPAGKISSYNQSSWLKSTSKYAFLMGKISDVFFPVLLLVIRTPCTSTKLNWDYFKEIISCPVLLLRDH